MKPAAALTSLFVAIAAFTAIGLRTIQPPSVSTGQADKAIFSVERALNDVRNIAKEPHPVGSAAQRAALDYIAAQLHDCPLDVKFASGSVNGISLTDVFASSRGEGRSNVILLVAHYDSVPAGPGASDDASGVATLLETARTLNATNPGKNQVAFLFTDGEEIGTLGARMFADGAPDLLKNVRVVLNFDSGGNRAPAVMFETGPRNLALIRALQACPHPVATSFAQDVYRMMPFDTDMTVFLHAGLTGLNFSAIEGSESYHTALDTWQNLDPRVLAHYGSYATTLVRLLASTDLGSLNSAQDAIYFTILRGVLVAYPQSWELPLAIGGSAFCLGRLAAGVVRKRLKILHVLCGALLAVCFPALAVASASGFLWFLKLCFQTRSKGVYLQLPHAGPIAAASIILTILAVVTSKYFLARRLASAEILGGALLVWLALAVATAIWLRGFSYLFLWPAVFATVSFWIISRHGEPTTLASILAVVFTVAAGCLLFSYTMLLAYYSLTIGLLPLLVGLASLLSFLFYAPFASISQGPGASR